MVKYLHVRAIDDSGDLLSVSGLTVAYTHTDKEIFLQVALCHNNDNFCFEIGRRIAKGRLECKKPEIVESLVILEHDSGQPESQTIIEYLELEYFSTPIQIFKDNKHRWVSTFEPNDGVEVVLDENWRNQMELEGDQSCVV